MRVLPRGLGREKQAGDAVCFVHRGAEGHWRVHVPFRGPAYTRSAYHRSQFLTGG